MSRSNPNFIDYCPSKLKKAEPFSRSGLTLVEVMVAMTLLALVLGSTVMIMIQGYRSVAFARETTQASQVLQTEMEYLRSLSWSELNDLGATSTFVPHFHEDEEPLKELVPVREVTTTKVDQVMITVSITWRGVYGDERKRKYQTLYSKRGLSDYVSRTF